MAQDVKKKSVNLKQRLLGKNLAVAVAQAGLTTLFEELMEGVERIFVTVENDGAQAFDQFVISAKAHPDGAYATLYTSYAAPAGILVGVSTTTPETLAAAGRSWLILDTKGIYQLKIEASANGGATTADIFVSGEGA